MNTSAGREFSVLWHLPIAGVEALHARFIRHKYPRHSHESVTVALVESGAAGFWYRGEDHIVGPGDVFLLNADEVHTGRPISPGGYLYRVLYLDPAALSSRPEAPWGVSRPRLSFRETVVHRPALAVTLRRIHRAIAAQESPMLAEELLLGLGQVLPYGYVGSPMADTRSSRCARGVRVARDYLEAHAAEKVLLRDLASAAETSPYRLVRMFSAEVGMPPHAYQTQLRVRLARRLLAEGIPAAKVAALVGFCDQAHLSRVFKSYTGVSPRQFSRGAGALPRPDATG